jgi:hypothetical protein
MNRRDLGEMITFIVLNVFIVWGAISAFSFGYNLAFPSRPDKPTEVVKTCLKIPAKETAPQPLAQETPPPQAVKNADGPTYSLNPSKNAATQTNPYSNPGNAAFGPIADLF